MRIYKLDVGQKKKKKEEGEEKIRDRDKFGV